MISFKPDIDQAIFQVTVDGKLQAGDFKEFAQNIDPLIAQHQINFILLDAQKMNGWKNFAALKAHLAFVKNHHKLISKVALVASHKWQYLLAACGKMFLHPQIKVFDKLELAKNWLSEKE